MRKFTVLGCLLLIGAAAQASPILIDEFDKPDGGAQQVCDPFSPPACAVPNNVTVSGLGSTVLGGQRQLTIQRTSGDAGVSASVDPFNNSTLRFNSDDEVSGILDVTWGNLAGVDDLTAGGTHRGIEVRIRSLEGGTASFTLFDGANSATSQRNIITGTIYHIYRFAFSEFGGVNTTSVDSIRLTLDGADSSDITVDYAAIYAPEPASMLLCGAGMLLVAWRMRKRKA